MLAAVPWLAAIVPMASIISVLAGALQGRQAFASLTASQSIGLVGLQTLPLTIAMMGYTSMPTLLAAAFVGRFLGIMALLWSTAIQLPIQRMPKFLPMVGTRSLLRFGGWVSVSGLVTPFLSIIDRFIVGGIVGAAAVTAYTVPYNVIQRFAFLPSALSTTLFPRFSSGQQEDAHRMMEKGILALIAIQTPLIVLAILIMRPFFNVWIGQSLSSIYYPVAIILLIGVWINGPAYLPHNLLPARGRPDVMARFYMVELLPFLLLLFTLVDFFGIYGAATAWTLRSIADAIFCFVSTNSINLFLRSIFVTLPSMVLAVIAVFMKDITNLWIIQLGMVSIILSVAASWYIFPKGILKTILSRGVK